MPPTTSTHTAMRSLKKHARDINIQLHCGQVVRAASAWDASPTHAKVTFGFAGTRHRERDSAAHEKGRGKAVVKKTPRSGGAGGFFGAGDWLAAAFTPRGALAPDPPVRCVCYCLFHTLALYSKQEVCVCVCVCFFLVCQVS